MSHVQIKSLPDGAFSLIVDGVEMAHNVLAEGLTIEFPKRQGDPVAVRMALAGDTVNLDLHNADVVA